MSRDEAVELRDFISALGGCEYASISRRRSGYALTVRIVGEPPRTYVNHANAFRAYCAADEENE
jgi:hypothetical protein